MSVSLATFGLVRIWDIFLAQNLAGLVSDMGPDLSVLPARIAYFVVMMVGIAFAGGLVAKMTFCVEDNFRTNARRSLAPAALAIFAPYLSVMVFSDGPVGYYPLIWVALAIPSLVGGARYAAWKISPHSRG